MRTTTPASRHSRRPSPARVRAWSVLLGAGLGAAVGSSCTLTLDENISCGDGYVDEEAGEDCDPAVPESYVDACPGANGSRGTAACNPEDCTIITTDDQCAVCGDGFVDDHLQGDRKEECDGDNLNGASCLGGVGTLQCSPSCRFDVSACRSCGNGEIDPGEECDPNVALDELTMGKPMCSELASPYPDRPYTAGTPGPCRDDCLWERVTCNYCGNGMIENGAFAVDFDGTKGPAEWCDGNAFDNHILNDELIDDACRLVDENLRKTVKCADSCLDFEFEDTCCIRADRACPTPFSSVRCCYELENPDSQADGACKTLYPGGGTVLEICR